MAGYLGKLTQNGLKTFGAAIKIKISHPNNSKPPKIGYAKLDTGGSHTQIEQELLEYFGGLPIWGYGTHSNSSVAHEEIAIYKAHLYFTDLGAGSEFNVTASNMKFEMFNGEPVIAVLGRDFLAGVKFTYNGKAGEYEIVI